VKSWLPSATFTTTVTEAVFCSHSAESNAWWPGAGLHHPVMTKSGDPAAPRPFGTPRSARTRVTSTPGFSNESFDPAP
jgi:hypothetical protein